MDKKLRDYCLHDLIYDAHIILIIGNKEEAEKLFKQKYKENFEIDTDVDGYTSQYPGKSTCIWLEKFNGTIDNYRTFVHELFHATTYILDSRGVKFSVHNDEPYAYYLSYLIKEFLIQIKGK